MRKRNAGGDLESHPVERNVTSCRTERVGKDEPLLAGIQPVAAAGKVKWQEGIASLGKECYGIVRPIRRLQSRFEGRFGHDCSAAVAQIEPALDLAFRCALC